MKYLVPTPADGFQEFNTLKEARDYIKENALIDGNIHWDVGSFAIYRRVQEVSLVNGFNIIPTK